MLKAISSESNPVLTIGRSEAHANVIQIDSQKPNESKDILTVGNILKYFPQEIRNRYKRLKDIADIALRLSHYIPVVGGEEQYQLPVEGEGRSMKVLINIPDEKNKEGSNQLLLEFKGCGARRLLEAKADSPTLSHGFPEDASQLYFSAYNQTVTGVENKTMGEISLVNGLVIGLHFLYENNIPLSEGLAVGGVTLPLVFRVSPDITNLIHSTKGYVYSNREDDKVGILVLAASSEERQQRFSLSSVTSMETRARGVRFLLENKIFYDQEGAHPQQFGENEALLGLFDFGDMIFASDIPPKVYIPYERKKKKEYSRAEIWRHQTYLALNRKQKIANQDSEYVFDGVFPPSALPGKYEEQQIIEWQEGIETFFHVLLEKKLQKEQVTRLIEVYPYFPREVTFLVASLFAEAKDSAISKSIVATRKRILKKDELAYIQKQYDMTETSSLSVDNIDELIQRMNGPLGTQVRNYIITGETTSELRPDGNIMFKGLVSLFKRVNESVLARHDTDKHSIYALTKTVANIYGLSFSDLSVFQQMKFIEFEKYPDDWVYKYVRKIALGV